MQNQKDPKAVKSWIFYDWANSVYSLVISTALFPIYYSVVTTNDGDDVVSFFGWEVINTAVYSYALSFSFFIVVLLSPVLSGLADISNRKKEFLKQFCYMGALAVASLFFFTGESTLWIGIFGTIIASVGFWGSQVFYNAYLPEIVPKDEQDTVSSKGFAMGYLGSALLLILVLGTLIANDQFLWIDGLLAQRISFVVVAIWWAGFAQITFRGLPASGTRVKFKTHHITDGYKQLIKTFKSFNEMIGVKTFLLGFFLFSTGVQTIILLATPFGSKVLGLSTEELIGTILIIQFVAIAGARMFAWLSGKFGNIKAIMGALFIWASITVIAYSLNPENPHVNIHFFIMGGLVGLVMGGIQSLARSTYSKMLPSEGEHTTYFSFYDVTEKLAIVVGTASFGLIEDISGDMQNSALFLAIFFIAAFLVISRVKYNFKDV